MKLQLLDDALTVCHVASMNDINPNDDLLFIGKTNEELSLVCKTQSVPNSALECEDGWRGFYITGTLDFSLIGILAKISAILAERKIGVFVISTYNTDYILIKQEKLDEAIGALTDNGYEFAG